MLYVNINFPQYIRYLEHPPTAASSAGGGSWIYGILMHGAPGRNPVEAHFAQILVWTNNK
jgi:hypothetical protein